VLDNDLNGPLKYFVRLHRQLVVISLFTSPVPTLVLLFCLVRRAHALCLHFVASLIGTLISLVPAVRSQVCFRTLTMTLRAHQYPDGQSGDFYASLSLSAPANFSVQSFGELFIYSILLIPGMHVCLLFFILVLVDVEAHISNYSKQSTG
jgi:hypothetical protein